MAEEVFADPEGVPASVAAEMKAQPTGIFVLGHDTREAGWRHGRLPGMRDPFTPAHAACDRMHKVASSHEKVTPERLASLDNPRTSADLWQAGIYRWAALFGVNGALNRVYRDDEGRPLNHPRYGGAVHFGPRYDAQHSSDELMCQTIDVTLPDWLRLLDELRTGWSVMFDAVWRRDVRGVDRLLLQNRRFPTMNFLRVRSDGCERFRAVVAIFWELERLFDLLHAFGGGRRVTMSRLLTGLHSTSSLTQDIAADTRTGRYIATMWCHLGPLALLFDGEPTDGHDLRHPHRAFGPGGQSDIVNEIEGCVTQTALDMATFNVRTATVRP